MCEGITASGENSKNEVKKSFRVLFCEMSTSCIIYSYPDLRLFLLSLSEFYLKSAYTNKAAVHCCCISSALFPSQFAQGYHHPHWNDSIFISRDSSADFRVTIVYNRDNLEQETTGVWRTSDRVSHEHTYVAAGCSRRTWPSDREPMMVVVKTNTEDNCTSSADEEEAQYYVHRCLRLFVCLQEEVT